MRCQRESDDDETAMKVRRGGKARQRPTNPVRNFPLDVISSMTYLATNAVAVPKFSLETRCYIRDPSCVGTFSNKIKHCVGV